MPDSYSIHNIRTKGEDAELLMMEMKLDRKPGSSQTDDAGDVWTTWPRDLLHYER